ncbi:hypothetical protein IFM89_013372 [Coptis chinensis]|uniref:Uncharacterized protein n=1 Tax=Coptis chinensis TaxID=261450 RepID=A0A835I4Q9_9MAGN|nr:hypothetical protein IFM89_013372 [Coptis chinensis]
MLSLNCSLQMDDDFDLDIEAEVREECSKYGSVKHIFVDKNSDGYVYLRFEAVAAASGAQRYAYAMVCPEDDLGCVYATPRV